MTLVLFPYLFSAFRELFGFDRMLEGSMSMSMELSFSFSMDTTSPGIFTPSPTAVDTAEPTASPVAVDEPSPAPAPVAVPTGANDNPAAEESTEENGTTTGTDTTNDGQGGPAGGIGGQSQTDRSGVGGGDNLSNLEIGAIVVGGVAVVAVVAALASKKMRPDTSTAAPASSADSISDEGMTAVDI